MAKHIDWNEEWRRHAYAYFDGKAHIPLDASRHFLLAAGPGFGDYSHPTTQIMMEMMPHCVTGRSVFDIGCGSGILSIAAARWGAQAVFLCDIDPEAVTHAKHNAALNGVEIQVGRPDAKGVCVLMNMITSNQQAAWRENRVSFSTLITSGVLDAERSCYLSFARTQGWRLQSGRKKGKWLGFVFTPEDL